MISQYPKMMEITNFQLLLTANFFYFLSAGIITPLLAPHIFKNGGNHIVMGVQIAALFVCTKYSKSVMVFFEHGKKSVVNLSLYCAFFSYLILAFCSTWWVIFADRCFYTITNQVYTYSKEYVTKMEPPDKHMRFLNMLDVAKVGGFVLGAITAGNIFVQTESFSVTAMVASVFIFLAIVLLQYMVGDTPGTTKHPSYKSQSWNLQIKNWDSVLLVVIYKSTLVIFFTKFAFLLSSNHQTSITVIGYTVAYQTMVIFACDRLLPLVKEVTQNRSTFKYCLVICGVTLNGLYFTSSYVTYLMFFVPMVISSSLVNKFLKEDVELGPGGVDSIQTVVSIGVPLGFGVLCQAWGAKAFKVLVALPVIICVYLVKKKLVKEEKQKEE